MTNSVVTGEQRWITVALPSPQPLVDMFGDKRAISQATLSFTDTVLKAVSLTASDGEEAYMDLPQLEKPETWPHWLRDVVADHRPSPFGTRQQLAGRLLAGLRAEATEHAAHADADERSLLRRLGELEPAEALTKLDELDLLTGALLRAATDVLRHLDRRTYGPAARPQD
ncbi:hypothetical protein ABZW47_29760 [Streptomyces sp. NPDC004549]|uniref:hypothetical protein n=1 Tax=Streptomyces sp. NPDC004549 TaxID=3154283 RepID=UPI0033BA1B7C